ncbi:MAG TPA: hypothetical protein VNI58_09425, partial [Mariprofundaceae bacterium]|nr:hypothetical protein [Mariprofundaceae bacterium]
MPAAAHLPAATQRPVQTEADVSAHMPAAMERPVEASGQPYVETISPDSAYAGITADTEPVDEQVVVPGSMPRAAGMVDESLPVTEETPLWPAGRPVTAVNPPEQTNMTQESPAAPASYNSLVVAAGQPERAAATGSRRNTVIASPEDAAIPAPGQLHRERRDDIDGEKLPEIQIHGTSARADNRPEAAVVSPRIGSDAPDMGKESPKAAMPSRDDGPAKGRQAPGQNRPAAIAASENGRGSDNETAAKGERGSGVLWHQPPRPAVAAELRP